MNYLRYCFGLFFIFALSVCSPKATTTYRGYSEYNAKEMYYTDKTGTPLGIQIYLVDSTFSKGREIYYTYYMYGYSIGKTIIGKKDMQKNKYSKYISCTCAGEFMPVSKRDAFFISRMRTILDSLKWVSTDFLMKINGFQKEKMK